MNETKLEEWVILQHKSLRRWINSQVRVQVTDLTEDLLDGLVLIELINGCSAKSGDNKKLILLPLHKKPRAVLQKIENVADFLKFAKLVLKLNICNISAEDIVHGNLKLTLGLVWVIFLYSTSKSIKANNNPQSFFQIKEILLQWINSITAKKGIGKITNFDRDWSLEINRPDILFFTILDFYIPSKYHIVHNGKRTQNLSEVFEIADFLNVTRLAEVDDFLPFVPDEKCVVMYLIEWYKVFELNLLVSRIDGKSDIAVRPSTTMPDSCNKDIKSEVNILDSFNEQFTTLECYIETILALKDSKLLYQTKAAFFLKSVETASKEMQRNVNFFNNFAIDHIIDLLNESFGLFNNAFNPHHGDQQNFRSLLKRFFERFSITKLYFKLMSEHLVSFEDFKNRLKAELIYKRFPQLESLDKDINTRLKEIGIKCTFEAPSGFSLAVCSELLSELIKLEDSFQSRALSGIRRLQTFPLRDLNSYLSQVETMINKLKVNGLKDETKGLLINCIDDIEYLINMCHQLDYYSRTLTLSNSTSSLKSCLEFPSPQCIESEKAPNMYAAFHDIFGKLNSMTYSDVISLMSLHTTPNYKKERFYRITEFVDLIPVLESTIGRSDSDYSVTCVSDSESDSLFDNNVRDNHGYTVYGNRMMNLSLFLSNIENGFKI